MSRAVNDRAHAPAWMGPDFSKIDGTITVKFHGSEKHLCSYGPPLSIAIMPPS